MLLQYLAKIRSSCFGISGKKENANENALIFEQTPNFKALSLLT